MKWELQRFGTYNVNFSNVNTERGRNIYTVFPNSLTQFLELVPRFKINTTYINIGLILPPSPSESVFVFVINQLILHCLRTTGDTGLKFDTYNTLFKAWLVLQLIFYH